MTGWVDEVREAAERAQPQIEGEIRVPGLRDAVEVIRDRWGVPHIYAATLDDLFVAQGFVVASERLFQIDSALRRIDTGEYGFCEVSGEPISLARLEARPIATMTVEAQERHERNERISRDD